VTGGKGRNLVKKEKVGVPVGSHYRVPAALELEQADYPPFTPKGPAYLSAGVMQATAVTVKRAALWRGDQIAKGCDSILTGHRSIE
jgi:hypothetical protein